MKIRTSFQNGFWAITDQGLFAGANFVLNILIARWLSVEEYGSFATLFSFFLLLSTVHTALITEPMLVLGPKINSGERLGYVKQVNKLNLIFSIILIVVLLVIAMVIYIWNSKLTILAIVFAFSAPMILFLWFVRRACYLFFIPKLAAFGGFIYLIIVVLISVFVNKSIGFNISLAFIIMGVSGLVIGLLILLSLISKGNIKEYSITLEVAKQHWIYGKWSLSSSGLYWIPRNFYFLILPLLYGVYFSGIYKALSNLIMPILQVNTALGILMITFFSRHLNKPSLKSLVKLFATVMITMSILYFIFLAIFRNLLVGLLYGKSNYALYSYLLIYMGIIPILTAGIEVAGALLRANERPKDIFNAYLIGSLFTVIFGTFFMNFKGLLGIVIGTIISYIALLASMLISLQHKILKR